MDKSELIPNHPKFILSPDMHNEKIFNQDMSLPESWDEVEIGTYAKVRDFIDDESIADSTMILKVIAALSGVKELSIRAAKGEDVERWVQIIRFIFESELPEPSPVDSFTWEGEYYTVAPDLGDATFGELIDADTELKNQRTPLHAAPGLISIYCRPEGEVYEGKRCLKRRESFSRLPVTTANDLAAFFLASLQGSDQILKLYGLRKIQIVDQLRTIRNSASKWGGLRPSWLSLRTIVCNTLRSNLRKQEKRLGI